MKRKYIALVFDRKKRRGAGLLPLVAANSNEARAMAQRIVGERFIIDEVVSRRSYEKHIRKFAIAKFIGDALWKWPRRWR